MVDIMITVDGNLTPIQQKVKAFQAQLQASQAQIASTIKVPTLPPEVLGRLTSPVVSAASKSAGRATQQDIAAQARIVALKLQELQVTQRLRGLPPIDFTKGEGLATKTNLITASKEAFIEAGAPIARGGAALTAEVNRFYATLAAPLAKATTNADVLRVFKAQANPVLESASLGVVTTPTAATLQKKNFAQSQVVTKLQAEADAAQIAAAEAEIKNAQARIAAASQFDSAAAVKGRARGLGAFEVQVQAELAYQAELEAATESLAASNAQIQAARLRREGAVEAIGREGRQRVQARQLVGPFASFQDQDRLLAPLDRRAADVTPLKRRSSRELGEGELGAAYGLAAKALERYAAIVLEEGALFALGTQGFMEAMALVAAEAEATMLQFRGRVAQNLATNPDFLARAATGKAETQAGNAVLGTAALDQRVKDPVLATQYQLAVREGLILTDLENAQIRAAIAGDSSATEATLLLTKAKQRHAITLAEAALADQEYVEQAQKLGALNAQKRALGNPTSQQNGPRGFFARIRGAETNASDLLGAGAVTTLKYAIPSAVLFGAFAGLSGAVKDSEELAINFTKLESQLKGFDSSRVREVKEEIIALSKSSGIEAALLAETAVQLQGAFAGLKFNAEDPTGSFGGLRGSDGIIRYGQEAVDAQLDAAAKLTVVTGIAQGELVDGLTAASFAFGASGDRIGDVATKLETATGVLAKETISFLGDIGPSAREAGFSLEEISALAAQVQKRSGQAGSAIAEQLTRVFAALGDNAEDFFNLAQSNKAAFGAQYGDFIKAIQTGDAKATFNILANSFEKLNKSSKDFIVNLLGGQRQANTLLAAFGDADGLAEANKAAADAAGTLDARYEKLQQRISAIFKRLKTNFNDFVKAIIDAGVGETVSSIAGSFEKIFKILGGVVGFAGQFNGALGGALSKIGSIVLQLVLFRKTFDYITKQNIGANISSAIASTRLGAAGAGAGGVGFLGNLFSGTRSAYRQSLINQAPLPGAGPMNNLVSQSMTNAQLRGRLPGRGIVGNLKASGAGLTALLGGAPGVGFLAVTGAFAAYDYISSAIESDQAEVREMRDKLVSSNATSKDLFDKAKSLRVRESGWYTFWHDFLDLDTEADAADVAAIIKQVEAENADTFNAASADPEAFNKVILGLQGKRLEAVQAVLADIPNNSVTAGYDDQTQKDLDKLLKEVVDATGASKENPLSSVILETLSTSDDIVGDLRDLLKETTDPKTAQQIRSAIKYYSNKAKADPRTAAVYADLRDPLKFLKDATDEEIFGKIDALTEALDAGRISISDYIKALETKINMTKAKSTLSDTDRKVISDSQKAITKAYSDYILNRQEDDLALAKLLGASDSEISLRTISNNLTNLNDVKFNDPEERRKAALAVLENTRTFYEGVAASTTDLELAQKLINEGFEIPKEVQQALFKSNIETSDTYKTIAKYYQAFRKSGKDSPQMEALLTRYGFDPKEGPGAQLDKILNEYFSTGVISDDTKSILEKQYRGLSNELKTNEKLTSTDKENIRGTLDFIAQLLGFAGGLAEIDPSVPSEALYSRGRGTGEYAKGIPPGTLFGESKLPTQAELDQEATNKLNDALKKNNDAKFDFYKTAADGDAVAIANIEKLQAQEEARIANALADNDPEKVAAQWGALAANVKADQALRDAYKQIQDAKFGFAKALADDSGDAVASAQTDLSSAQADLAYAQSRNDAAGILQAQAAIVQARGAIRDAIKSQRDAQAAYLKAVITREDPVLQAQFDLNLAKIQLGEARGVAERATAALAVLEAERALRDSMSEARQAVFNLREAQLQSLDDDVGAANVQAAAARAQLQDAIARGAGSAEITNLQAAVITADRNARDVLFNTRLDDYRYLLDTGKITKSQYIQYLTALQQTLDPASKQFKELEITLRQLRNDIGSDLQANLPTNLSLPTLYEVRRLNQTSQSGAGAGQTIGYLDQRNVDIQIIMQNGMSESQVLNILSNALGTGRNSSVQTRF